MATVRGVVSFMLSVRDVGGRRGGGEDKDNALCCLGIDVKVVRRKEEEEEEEKWEGSWFCRTQAATVATALLFVVRQ